MADTPTTNGTLHFRVANPDDAPQIQSLVQSAFRAEDTREAWTADMALGATFTVSVADISKVIALPRDSGAILIAFASPYPSPSHSPSSSEQQQQQQKSPIASVEVHRRPPDLARICMLAVDQRHQQAGVGRRVLAHAEQFCAREWGVRRMGLNAVSTRKQLIRWYARCGYKDTGTTSPFPRERFDELELPEDLCFVELEKELDAGPGSGSGSG
ncbi:putative N-acetyltransferase, GNAT family [Xylariomycetidae sp. FL2044]|nr:putative N-acetyltransferase, GNAT family [Xylariomycetidae sp. FL2044]